MLDRRSFMLGVAAVALDPQLTGTRLVYDKARRTIVPEPVAVQLWQLSFTNTAEPVFHWTDMTPNVIYGPDREPLRVCDLEVGRRYSLSVGVTRFNVDPL